MQEIVLLKIVDVDSLKCALSGMDGEVLGEVFLTQDVARRVFPSDRVAWSIWSKTTARTPDYGEKTDWHRKAAAMACSFNKRCLERYKNRGRARLNHMPFETTTWDSAVRRIENSGRMRWYRKMRSPWQAWAETCTRNHREKLRDANAKRKRDGEFSASVD